MKHIFFEEDVVAIITLVRDMIMADAATYQQCYKYLCDHSDINDALAGHIMTVIQQCRNK